MIIIIVKSSEYDSLTKLDYVSGSYFAIPECFILNKELNEKRISVFSYFSMRRGIDYSLSFSINEIIRWMRKKPDRHANGINNKIIQVINYLANEDYLYLSEEVSNPASVIDSQFNISKHMQIINRDRFATIYSDEVLKILGHTGQAKEDVYSNSDIVLMVFAYLRMRIYRRRNQLFPEEINLDNKNDHQYDIDSRRLKSPEAYNCFYYNIADDLGISERAVSKAIDVLCELGLIYYEQLPRIKHNGKWRTDHTIFCNAYKREESYLITSGSSYYLPEIESKKKKIK